MQLHESRSSPQEHEIDYSIAIFWRNNDVFDKNCSFHLRQSEIGYKVHMGGTFAQKQFNARVANNGVHFFQQPQFQNSDCFLGKNQLHGGWKNGDFNANNYTVDE